MDPKRLVADGYDRLCGTYDQWGAVDTDPLRQDHVDRVMALGLHPPADALDLGCNTGSHGTQYLVGRGFQVTGVDISPRCIDQAARAIPTAQFLLGDIATIDFPDESFDLVTTFYSLIHVPKEEQPSVLSRIRNWLRPGGYLIATMGGSEESGEIYVDSWLGGVPMSWSNWDSATNLRLIREAGLGLVESRIESVHEDDNEVHFLWVIARRPAQLAVSN